MEIPIKLLPLLLLLFISSCARSKHVPVITDQGVHELHTIHGAWRLTGGHDALMVTETARDIPAGVKEICGVSICTLESAGILTKIHIQEKGK